jgi:hypothetical protein
MTRFENIVPSRLMRQDGSRFVFWSCFAGILAMTEDMCGFSQPLHANSAKASQLDHYNFISNPCQFITRHSYRLMSQWRLATISSQINCIIIHVISCFKIDMNIRFAFYSRVAQVMFSLQVIRIKLCIHFLSDSCYMQSVSHLSYFHRTNNVRREYNLTRSSGKN